MATKKVVEVPNEILHRKCEEITEFNDETKQLAENLVDTVLAAKNPEAAGLAAPQIGSTKRICVVRRFFNNPDNSEIDSSKEYILINPLITKTSKDKSAKYEGCLSIPDTYVPVERPNKIKIEAYDVDGNKFKINTSGFFARVIQHEIDHLDGILMTDPERALDTPISEKELENLMNVVE